MKTDYLRKSSWPWRQVIFYTTSVNFSRGYQLRATIPSPPFRYSPVGIFLSSGSHRLSLKNNFHSSRKILHNFWNLLFLYQTFWKILYHSHIYQLTGYYRLKNFFIHSPNELKCQIKTILYFIGPSS